MEVRLECPDAADPNDKVYAMQVSGHNSMPKSLRGREGQGGYEVLGHRAGVDSLVHGFDWLAAQRLSQHRRSQYES